MTVDVGRHAGVDIWQTRVVLEASRDLPEGHPLRKYSHLRYQQQLTCNFCTLGISESLE